MARAHAAAALEARNRLAALHRVHVEPVARLRRARHVGGGEALPPEAAMTYRAALFSVLCAVGKVEREAYREQALAVGDGIAADALRLVFEASGEGVEAARLARDFAERWYSGTPEETALRSADEAVRGLLAALSAAQNETGAEALLLGQELAAGDFAAVFERLDARGAPVSASWRDALGATGSGESEEGVIGSAGRRARSRCASGVGE